MTTRWPLHPAPIPGEALTSWLHRLADPYDIDLTHLFFDLGFVLDRDTDLDVVAPDGFIDQLALRTGVDATCIQMMSISGYAPWLIDDVNPGPDAFTTYTRQLSVLLPEGKRRHRKVDSWRAWLPAPGSPRYQLCPQCVDESVPPRPYQLVWSWPLMLTCPYHHCLLEPYDGAPGYYFTMGAPPPASRTQPVDHAVKVLDRRTWQALTCGYVDLPRRRVHAGIWFRLLRTVLDELGATSAEYGAAREEIRAIWHRVGYPVRAGQTVWRPYEGLSIVRQQQTLEAAAAAMHLVETSVITGRGLDATLFLPEPDISSDPGPTPQEEPDPLAVAWQKAQDSVDAMIEKATYDPDTAQHFFQLMTYPSTSEKAFQRVRDSFTRLGIPLEFLSP